MNSTAFNFQHVDRLWALIFIPLVSVLWTFKKSTGGKNFDLERFADKHLLPFLLKNPGKKSGAFGKHLFTWVALWALGVMAIAGPRWNFRNVQNFKPQKNLVILLSLSKSMDETDIKPSRLIRAKEKIDDILGENPDVNVGLIVFGNDPHLVTPVTEDKNAIRYLSGALRTDLIPVQGNRLAPALAMAERSLAPLPGKEKALLVISDGSFSDKDSQGEISRLVNHGVRISTIDFGVTGENKKTLRNISRLGAGGYFLPGDTLESPQLFGTRLSGDGVGASGITRDWEPRFYIFLIPFLFFMVPLFRKQNFINSQKTKKASLAKVVVAIVGLLIFGHSKISLAGEASINTPTISSVLGPFFKNQDTLGENALARGDYRTAETKFSDSYRRGVAQYRAGDFPKAEESFRDSKRPEVAVASRYNLGNSYAEQGKYEQAIQAYENVLKSQPNHDRAKKNLKIVQDLLKRKSQDPKQSEGQRQAQNQRQKQSQPGQGQGQGQEKEKNENSKQSQNQKQGEGEKQARSGEQGEAQSQKENKDQGGGENQKQSPAQAQKQESDQKKDQGQRQAQREGKEGERNDHGPDAKQPPRQAGDQGGDGANQHDEQIQARKTQRDVDADQWLNRITNDPHGFLKNQFLIESLRAQAKKGEQL